MTYMSVDTDIEELICMKIVGKNIEQLNKYMYYYYSDSMRSRHISYLLKSIRNK